MSAAVAVTEVHEAFETNLVGAWRVTLMFLDRFLRDGRALPW